MRFDLKLDVNPGMEKLSKTKENVLRLSLFQLFVAIPSPPHIKEIVFAKGSLSPTIHWHSSDNMENLKPILRFKKSGASDWVSAARQGIVTAL